MQIGGLQKISLIDYPDKLAAIIFTVGCNFRCGFCYNPELVTIIDENKLLEEGKIMNFLEKRKKVLDAVVISGGEPTLQKELIRFIKDIKAMDFLVKLDTNGSNPAVLEKLLKEELVDYVAMDIKSNSRKYMVVARTKINIKDIKKSISLTMKLAKDYEFRSTILPKLHSASDVVAMSKMIKGAKRYYLQQFQPVKKMIDMTLKNECPYGELEMNDLARQCLINVKLCKAR